MSTMISLPVITAAVFPLAAFLIYATLKKERGRNPNCLPYPPGPKGYPFIRSYFDIPRKQHWLGFKRLSNEYGDIMFIRSLRINYLVLDSVERINDILEKRSANYSDRIGVMLLDLMKWDFHFAFVPYDGWWRRQRRTFHDYFNVGALKEYDEIQTREVHAFLRNLLLTPEDLQDHITLAINGIFMQIVYGITQVPGHSKNSTYAESVREPFAEGLAVAAIPGMYLVDHFPILKWLPAWFPGGNFQNVAAKAKELVHQMTVEHTMDVVKRQMEDGSAIHSMATQLLGNMAIDADDVSRTEQELLIRNVTGTSYAAGSDTTVSSISAFFLAMAMFPDAQKKAQAEIDSITRSTRLPDFQDRSSMPYIEALILELMRWHPVGPLAGPHVSSKDDEYNGYFIPKGTVVIPNVWSIFNDPEVYPDPSKFDPDRFMNNPNLRSPHQGFFGYGRRACPGKHFADRNIFAVITNVLAVFDILPPIDREGNTVPLKYSATTGLVAHPDAFSCRIVQRSAVTRRLILETQ